MRQSAAENLGQLTRMSMRLDQLAGDLLTNCKAADPTVQESYLTAVRGMLLVSGQRLSQPVWSRAAETLQSMMASAGTANVLCRITIFRMHWSVPKVQCIIRCCQKLGCAVKSW